MKLTINQPYIFTKRTTEHYQDNFLVVDTVTLNKGKECTMELLNKVPLSKLKDSAILYAEFKRLKKINGKALSNREYYYEAIANIINLCSKYTSYVFSLIKNHREYIDSHDMLEELAHDVGFSIQSLYETIRDAKLTISLTTLEDNIDSIAFTDMDELTLYMELNKHLLSESDQATLDKGIAIEEDKALTLLQGIVHMNKGN